VTFCARASKNANRMSSILEDFIEAAIMPGYNERGVVDPGADILRLFKYATTKIAISTSNHKGQAPSYTVVLHTYRSNASSIWLSSHHYCAPPV